MPNPLINITIKAIGFDEVERKFKSVDIQGASQEGLEAFAFTTERYSKLSAPVDTGRMRASIATDIGNMRARIAPHVSYAIFVHEGTRFMKATPFMAIGLGQAQAKLFSGKGPFVTAIQKELDRKLR